MFRTAIAISTLLAAAAPAVASDLETTRSVSVRHGDLDLTTDRGVAALNKRIGVAARAVCGTFHPADLDAKQHALACRAQSMADASRKVELAVAAARTGEQFAGSIAVGAANP